MSTTKSSLTKSEVGELVILLGRVAQDGFPVPEPVFFAWLRATYTMTVDLAVLWQTPEGLKIFLSKRPANDPFYPGEQQHIPGTIIFPGETVKAAKQRLMKSEFGTVLKGAKEVRRYEELYGTGPRDCPRGHTVVFLHVAWVGRRKATKLTKSGKGQFFPIYRLPRPMVSVHGEMMIPWLRRQLARNTLPSL